MMKKNLIYILLAMSCIVILVACIQVVEKGSSSLSKRELLNSTENERRIEDGENESFALGETNLPEDIENGRSTKTNEDRSYGLGESELSKATENERSMETGENQQSDSEVVTVQAKIVDWSEQTLLVVGEGENFSGLYHVNISDTLIPNHFYIGAVISFSFSGEIAEMKPALICNPSNITVVEFEGDTIGIYREAFEKLRNTDSALEQGVTQITLDLAGVHNLTCEEKDALTYLVSLDSKMSAVNQGTFQQLEESGLVLVNEEGFTRLEDSILYTISSMEESDGFIFDIIKYRSSLGAYGFIDCKATLKKNHYTWEVGIELIS